MVMLANDGDYELLNNPNMKNMAHNKTWTSIPFHNDHIGDNFFLQVLPKEENGQGQDDTRHELMSTTIALGRYHDKSNDNSYADELELDQ
jgi:hypothetical protein